MVFLQQAFVCRSQPFSQRPIRGQSSIRLLDHAEKKVVSNHILSHYIQPRSLPLPSSRRNLVESPERTRSQRDAAPLLLLLRRNGTADASSVAVARTRPAGRSGLHLKGFPVVSHDGQDRLLEDFLDACHLLAAALHVARAHLLGDRQALLRRDGRQALCLEHLDARLLVAQV